MRITPLLLGAGVVVCVVAATQPTNTQAPVSATAAAPVVAPAQVRTVANVPMPALTPEEAASLARVEVTRLDAARAHVTALAQRAVRDSDEQLFREPTPAEAAALALPAETGAAQEIPVPVGGYAVKTDASGLSLAVATVGADGVVSGHGVKGGHRDR